LSSSPNIQPTALQNTMHNNIVIIINTKQLQYTNVCYKNMLNKINQTVKKNVLWSKVLI